MDIVKIGIPSSGQEHHSDEMEFRIKPYEVAPPPPPISWASILGLLIVGGIIYVATR